MNLSNPPESQGAPDLAALIAHVPAPMAAHAEGRILAANELLQELLALGAPEGRQLADFIEAPGPERVAAHFAAAEPRAALRATLRRPDGVSVHVEMHTSQRGAAGAEVHFTTLCDLADAERYAMQSRGAWSRFIRLGADATFVTSADRVFLDANEAAERLTGYTREELLGMRAEELLLDPRQVREGPDFEMLQQNMIHRAEQVLRRKDGALVPIQANIGVLGEDAVIAIVRDVTEQRAMEASLRASEARFRLLAEQARDMVFRQVFYPERRFDYVSPSCYELTGYTPQEHYDDPFLNEKITVEEYRVPEEKRPALADGEVHRTRWRRKDGVLLWIEERVVLVRDAEGRPVAVEGIARDVTAQVEAELALARREQFYRALYEQSGVWTTIANREGRFTDANDAALRALEYTLDAFKQLSLDDVTHPEDRDPSRAYFSEIVEGKRDTYVLEKRYVTRSGRTIHTVLHTSAVRDEGGGFLCGMGQVHDVSARRAAEAALRASEMRFRTIFDAAPLGIILADLQERIMEPNPAFCAMTGYTAEELRDKNWRDLTHPDDIAAEQEMVDEMLAGLREGYANTKRYVRKDGGLLTARLSLVIIRSPESRQPRYVLGLVRDITEQKAIEDALRQSERRYRLFAENATDVLFRVGVASRAYEFISPAIEAIAGYAPEELIGNAALSQSLVGPEDLARLSRILEGEESPAETMLVQWMCKDGRLIWTEQRVTAVRDESGAVVAFEGIARDVTARVLAEQRLQASEERFRMLFERASDGILILSPEGVLTDANDQALRLLGHTRASLLGTPYVGIIGPESLISQPLMLLSLEEGESRFLERAFVRADGEYLLAEVGLTRMLGGEIQMIFRDVTSRKAYEQGLIEARREAEEMSRMKDNFLANMSHEIRTPLTAIIGYADLLADEATGATFTYAETIRQSGERLMETLNSVMDLAQLTSGALKLRLKRTDILAEVRKSMNLFAGRAAEKNLSFVLEAPENPVSGMADAAALGRVLNNLLSNALKFTPEGGVAVRVAEAEGRVRIEVRDTGIGISNAFQPYVFDEFRQESSGHSRRFEGNGLGLAITRQLVDLMNGVIEVESRPGEGAVFIVTLPAADEAPGPQAEAPGREAAFAPAAARILIVDDDPNARLLIRTILQEGAEVREAEDPEGALAFARAERVDLVLLDINLGRGAGGPELLEALRALPGYNRVPIVAVTAYALPGDGARMLDQGFDAYLSKPFRKAELAALVARLVHRSN